MPQNNFKNFVTKDIAANIKINCSQTYFIAKVYNKFCVSVRSGTVLQSELAADEYAVVNTIPSFESLSILGVS